MPITRWRPTVARSHAVTALIQAAAKDRLRGDAAARAPPWRMLWNSTPETSQVTEHLYELGDDALRGQSRPLYEQARKRRSAKP